VPASETSSASSIINFLRTLAIAIATAVIVSRWSRATVSQHATLVEFQSRSGQFIQRLAHNGFSHGAALQTLDAMTWQQAMVLAVDDVFTALSLILVLAAMGIWLIPKLAPTRGALLH
jgi:DHA2 family multidrug resistance protein